MLIRNYTPFVPFYFESEDHDHDLFATFMLKATFRIENGCLTPEQLQQPITMGDEHYGEPASSSVRLESDLCPHKSGTDLFVIGHAVAPNEIPAKQWDVFFYIQGQWGTLQKTVRVTGPREWHKSLLGWNLSDPEPVEQVLLQYENAYGGHFKPDDDPEIRFEQNPTGKGFAPSQIRRSLNRIPGPQIERPEFPIRTISDQPFPEGFGPICKSWKSRTDIAGTYDENWLENHWPHLPEDFDFDFYMAAHPDLQLKEQYLNCDEVVHISGMSLSPIEFKLPEYNLAAFFTTTDDDIPAGNMMNLDTMCVDTDAMTVTLVWRIATPKDADIREIESRMLIRGVPPRGR